MTPFPEIPENPEILELDSRSIIWAYENNGFDTFGSENDHQNSCIFDFQGLIYLKVEHAYLSTYSEF